MKWPDTTVLVTGAGGFIGSHLAERLVGLGARTRCFVHYNALGRRGWLDGSPAAGEMEIVAGDIADRDSVQRACAGVEVVFHLAALIAIPFSYRAPESYVRTNVLGTLNLLRAAADHGVRRIVHTSTSEVYGTARSVPMTEDHPLQAQSPYAASKIGADKIAESFHHSFGAPVVIVRPFNTFGPRQSARAVVPTIILQLLRGDTVRLGNLSPRRDLNFVANTVDAFLAAATGTGIEGATVHFGSGREIAVGDLCRLIAGRLGRQATVETEEERARPGGSEVERLLADNRRARELLGWQPAVDLETGLDRTIDWFRSNRAKYRADEYGI